MAKFTLTPGTDHFTGISGQGNEFEFRADTLQSTDVITGATGAFIDVMALSGSAPVAFGQFAGVSGIDRLDFNVPGSVELSNELVGNSPGLFPVNGSAGADTIERIASITAAVEICFIGLFASRAWKWRSGSGDSPNKMAAGLFRGRQ